MACGRRIPSPTAISSTTPSSSLTTPCSAGVSSDAPSAGQTDTDEARIGTESVAFDERAFDSRFSSGVVILHIGIVGTGAALSLMPELDDALVMRTACLMRGQSAFGNL